MIFDLDQYKGFTKEVALMPETLEQSQNAINSIAIKRAGLLDLDGRNKLFFDRALKNVKDLHTVLRLTHNEKRTLYKESYLLDSKRNTLGTPHFPDDIGGGIPWTKIQPKILPSNNGLPKYTISKGSNELRDVLVNYEEFLNNSTLSSKSVPTGSFTGSSFPVDDTSGFTVNRVFALLGGDKISFYRVTGVVLNSIVNCTYLSGDDLVTYESPNVTIAGFGFSQVIKDALNDLITSHATLLGDINDIADNNELLGSIKNTLNDLKTSNESFLLILGGYNDPEDLIPHFNNRETILDTLKQDVYDAIGSISQNPDGTYSGSGEYFTLFKWIDSRIGMAVGSLSNYYSTEIAITTLTAKDTLVKKQKEEYEKEYNAKRLIKRLTVGETLIYLDSVDGLNVSDEIDILDDNSSMIYTRNIVQVDTLENTLIIDQDLPEEISHAGAVGRVIKKL